MDRCKYCGSDSGYYTKDYIQGPARYYHAFDGSDLDNKIDNSSYYDGVTIKEGKYAYCIECDKCLGKVKDVINNEN